MGGSRRRLKKGKAKVRVGVVKKNKTLKAKLPKELADPTRRAQTAAALAALGVVAGAPAAAASPKPPPKQKQQQQQQQKPRPPTATDLPPASALWREQAPVAQNYANVALLADVNEAFGRNRANRARPAGAGAGAPALRPAEARAAAGERTHEDDDELRAAMRLPRHSGKNAPQRLTATAEAVVGALLEAHGRGDLGRWVKDTKRNRMQHSEGRLRAMLEAYDYYNGEGAGAGAAKKHRFQPPKKPYKRL